MIRPPGTPVDRRPPPAPAAPLSAPQADAPRGSDLVWEAIPDNELGELPPVQRLAYTSSPVGDGDPAAIAARGIAGPGGALPHADAIQRSFGHHDIGGVEAHVGGDAATASEQLGARAYATGKAVAFASPPDLHTAAHEAAHVVQQQSGVAMKSLDGGKGDPHEHHADAVADAVVAGRSAEALLDAAPGGGAPAIQRDSDPGVVPTSAMPKLGPAMYAEFDGDRFLFQVRVDKAKPEDPYISITYAGPHDVDGGTEDAVRPLRKHVSTVKSPLGRGYTRPGLWKDPLDVALIGRSSRGLRYDMYSDGRLIVEVKFERHDKETTFDERTHLITTSVNGVPITPRLKFFVMLPKVDARRDPAAPPGADPEDADRVATTSIVLMGERHPLHVRRWGEPNQVALRVPGKANRMAIVQLPTPIEELRPRVRSNDDRTIELDLDSRDKADVRLIHTVEDAPQLDLSMERRHLLNAYTVADGVAHGQIRVVTEVPLATAAARPIPTSLDPKANPAPDGTPYQGGPPGQEDIPGEVAIAIPRAGRQWEIRIDADGDRSKELLLRFEPKQPIVKGRAATYTVHITEIGGDTIPYELSLDAEQAEVFDRTGPTQVHLSNGMQDMAKIQLAAAAGTRPEAFLSFLRLDSDTLAVQLPNQTARKLRLVSKHDYPSYVVESYTEEKHHAGVISRDFELGEYRDRFRVTLEATPDSQKIGYSTVRYRTVTLGLAAIGPSGPIGGFGVELEVQQPALRLKGLEPASVKFHTGWSDREITDLTLHDVISAPSPADPPSAHRDHRITVEGPAARNNSVEKVFSIREGVFVPDGFGKERVDRFASGAATAVGQIDDQLANSPLEAARIQLDTALTLELASLLANDPKYAHIPQQWMSLSRSMVAIEAALKPTAPGKNDNTVNQETLDTAIASSQQVQDWLDTVAMGEGPVNDGVNMGDTIQVNPYTGRETRGYAVGTTQIVLPFLERLRESLDKKRFPWGDIRNSLGYFRQAQMGVGKWVQTALERKHPGGEQGKRMEYINSMRGAVETIDGESEGKAFRIGAVFTPDEQEFGKEQDYVTYKNVPLQLFAWRNGDRWHIRDVTTPTMPWEGSVSSSSDKVPLELIKELDSDRHLPKGHIRWQSPDGAGGTYRVESKQHWSDFVGRIALVIAAVGLAVATFGGAAPLIPAAYLFAASAVLGGVAAVGDLMHAMHHGYATDTMIVLNVLQIVGSFATAGAITFGRVVMAARGAATAWTGSMARLAQLSQPAYRFLAGVSIASDASSLLVMSIDLRNQLAEIDANIKDPEARKWAKAKLLAMSAVTGGMMMLSIKGDLPSIASSQDSLVIDMLPNGTPVARPAGVSLADQQIKLETADANTHAGARWQTADMLAAAREAPESPRGVAAHAVAGDKQMQKIYADWMASSPRVKLEGGKATVIPPKGATDDQIKKLQDLVDSSDMAQHQKAFDTAVELAKIRKAASDFDVDPNSPRWKTTNRAKLVGALGGDRAAEDLVARYEASALGARAKDLGQFMSERATVNRVIPDSEIERLRQLWPEADVYVSGAITTGKLDLDHQSIEVTVVPRQPVEPAALGGMEQRAGKHLVYPDPDFLKAMGNGPGQVLHVKTKVMTRDQFAGMATAGSKAPHYHKLDSTLSEVLGNNLVPLGGNRFRANAADLDSLHAQWANRGGTEKVGDLHFDPRTGTMGFEIDVGRGTARQRLRVTAALPIARSADDVLANKNTIVGAPVKATQGLDILRQANTGDLGALDATGVAMSAVKKQLPEGTEFGLGRLPNGDVVIIRGELGAVDWTNFPGITPLAHTHPAIKGNDLLGVKKISIGELGTPDAPGAAPNLNRHFVLPHPVDIALMAQRNVDGHRVVTGFHVRDGWVFKPGGDEGVGDVLELVIHQPREIGTLPTGEKVYRSVVTGHAGKDEVLRRDVWAVSGGKGGDHLRLTEPPGIVPKQVDDTARAADTPRAPITPSFDIQAFGKHQLAEAGIKTPIDFPAPMQPDDFVKKFGSEKARAVFVLEPTGEIRIYSRADAREFDIRAEVQHAKQMQDPDMAAEIRLLHNPDLATNWSTMSATDRVELLRRQLAIEIDAHQGMLRDSGDQLDEISEHLRELLAKQKRIEALSENDIVAMNTGRQPMHPDLLNPAWLFGKQRGPKRGPALEARTDFPTDAWGMRLPETGPERSAAYSNLKDVEHVHQLGTEWREYWQVTSGYAGTVTAITPGPKNGTTIEITTSTGAKHTYVLEEGATPTVEVGQDDIQRGMVLGDNPERRYREVEIRFKKGPPIKRQEIRQGDGSWVQRGSDSTAAGSAMEDAAREQATKRLDARKATAAAKGTYFDYKHLDYPQGSGGFDNVIVELTGSPTKPKAKLRVREVKDYPNRHVPGADFTAIRNQHGGNLDTNMDTLYDVIRTQVNRLDADELLQPDGAFAGLTREQVYAISDAYKKTNITFEIVLGPDTLIGKESKKGSSVISDLRDELRTKFKKDVLLSYGGRSPERVGEDIAAAHSPKKIP